MGSDSRTNLASRGAFLIANSMESEPRVVALAQLHKTCGTLDFSLVQIKSARGGSDSRMDFFFYSIKKHLDRGAFSLFLNLLKHHPHHKVLREAFIG
jgi:hypothetical protein